MDKFKALLAELDLSKNVEHNEKTLRDLAVLWNNLKQKDLRVTEHLKGNIIFPALAQVMEERYTVWKDSYPAWIKHLMFGAKMERDFEDQFFPEEHLRAIEKVHRRYFLNGCQESILSLRQLSLFNCFKRLLMQDDEVYNKIKSNLQEDQIMLLYTLSGSESWAIKMLRDTQLIQQLLNIGEAQSTRRWNLFVSLAQHSDAKSLLPKEVLLKASQSSYARRMELCALLCSEDDLKALQVDYEWLASSSKILELLMTKGVALIHDTYYHLLNIILPISNLSTVEAMKVPLGTQLTNQLINLIVEDLPDTAYTTRFATKARQEASKALWNLAYMEKNRELIAKYNGINKLFSALSASTDSVLKRNINGILHMFNTQQTEQKPQEIKERLTRGHIMISYNWGNQPIVKRIAKELQDQGYHVWLDIEQMGGSTLEAMAAAIEHSELVLICMSQKYKDSPNCRLEGEYCVNCKIPFVPLMMQKNYRPDGWLGITLGSRLYYEFADEDGWDSKMTQLVKAIGERGKLTGTKDKVPQPVAVIPQTKPSVEWTDSDLLQWMKEERIDQHYELFKKHKLGRRALLEWQRRDNTYKNPNFFFTSFEKLGIVEFGEVLLLAAAIHNLK